MGQVWQRQGHCFLFNKFLCVHQCNCERKDRNVILTVVVLYTFPSVAGCNVGHRLLYKNCLLCCLFSGWCALSTTTARSRSLEEEEKYQVCAASSTFRIDNSILFLTTLMQLKARKIKNKISGIQVPMVSRQTLFSATVLLAGQHRSHNLAPKCPANQQKCRMPS